MPNLNRPNFTPPKSNIFLATAILLTWIVTVAFLFWHLHFRYYTTWTTFNSSAPQQDNLALESDKLSVVHFIDQACSGTRFSLTHSKKVETKFRAETVAYRKIICGEGQELLSKVLSAPNRNGQLTHQETIACFCQWTNKFI